MPLNTFSRSLHQFSVGRVIYLRGHTSAFTVIGQGFHRGWPHYEIEGILGDVWRVSQLELSSKPIQHGGWGR